MREATAIKKLDELLAELAPGKEWAVRGVVLWSTAGHKASQVLNLWTGRALLGIMGDMLHQETKFLGVIGVAKDDTLVLGKIGETSEPADQDVLRAQVDPEPTLVAALRDVSAETGKGRTLVLRLARENRKLKLEFPALFMVGNGSLPEKIAAMCSAAHSTTEGLPD